MSKTKSNLSHVDAPAMKRPCSDCPFRKDSRKGWLGRSRMREITQAQTFVCHKTTQGDERDLKQCAGHMLLNGEQNQFVRFANRINWKLDLSGRELVFDNQEQAIDHRTNYDQ